MPPLTASDWVTIVTCICSSGSASVIANHISTAIRDKKRFEDTPSMQARNTISRHSAFCMLKSIHRDAVRRGYIPLEELDEAQEIYDAYQRGAIAYPWVAGPRDATMAGEKGPWEL